MFTCHISQSFKFSFVIIVLLLVVTDYCFCINTKSINASLAGGFGPAIATWYGDPNGAGSTGGACGFGNDVTNPTYNSLISAGNQALFKSGKGCGACYQVKCTQNPQCSRSPITVTITDECPGSCNNDPIHFDLSGKAFGYLAKPGQADALRNAGRINIEYKKVPCNFNARLTFKIDKGSNPFYLAFAVEYLSGDGEIGSIEISSSNSNGWRAMQRTFGATWKVDLPSGVRGPFSVRITTLESRTTIVAPNVIPANWAPGQYYHI
ncbi:hypothetical protein DH2020_021546 [Rehmannia glutinosa]|uniref:Uncharacterized protein n=1 Tax=Rehmannia glutinosa TaxID=99300 RepID=A0ABR0WAR6_REHGL